jgi:hypothetical protein
MDYGHAPLEVMTMKRLTLLALVTLALAASSGCIVRSVFPWFNSSDVVFVDDLLGGWIGTDPDGKEVAMTFVRTADAYTVQYSGSDLRGAFRATLGKVAGEYYLDFRPIEGAPGIDGLLLFPTHSIARLEIGSDKLNVYTLNYEGLKQLARNDRFKDLKVAWDEEDELLLVSQSAELRHFLLGYSRSADLFNQPIRLARKKA